MHDHVFWHSINIVECGQGALAILRRVRDAPAPGRYSRSCPFPRGGKNPAPGQRWRYPGLPCVRATGGTGRHGAGRSPPEQYCRALQPARGKKKL